jgi:hypothetical protein
MPGGIRVGGIDVPFVALGDALFAVGGLSPP